MVTSYVHVTTFYVTSTGHYLNSPCGEKHLTQNLLSTELAKSNQVKQSLTTKMWTSVRKAITGLQREGKEAGPWDTEVNLFKRDVKRFGHIFVSETVDEKEYALRSLGHAVYAGGVEAASVVTPFVPLMMSIVRSRTTPTSLRLQALRTLSEVCHRNRLVQDAFRRDNEAMTALLDMIGDIVNIRLSRWSVYLLHLLMVDNEAVVDTVRDIPGVFQKLKHAADFPTTWQPWGMNVPMVVMKVLNTRRPLETDPKTTSK